MPDTTYPITGIRAGWGPDPEQDWSQAKNIVPTRVEVDEFFLNARYDMQRDLLYLAMDIFQKMSPSDKLSYFQVAGIHGLPHIPWDAPGMYTPQYCQHGNVKFATWHRPYMLLFEQRLYEIMVNELLPKYPTDAQDAVKKAADQFRLPYWDWGLKKERILEKKEVKVYDLPLIVKLAKVQVTNLNSVDSQDSLIFIDNPFYSFRAPGPMGEYGIIPLRTTRKEDPYKATFFDRVMTTSRMASPGDTEKELAGFYSADGVNDFIGSGKDIREASWYQGFDKDGKPIPGFSFKLAEATDRLLSPEYFTSYPQFATMDAEEAQDGKYYLSLEGIHNNVHNWTGQGFSHMAHVPVAAFDPIFWLHHANIDRLLAMWQELNSDKWWDKVEYTRGGKTFTAKATDDLKPFRRDESSFYTSNTSRNFFELGYTYPELKPWKFESKEAYITSIRDSIHDKYSSPAETQLLLSNYDVIVIVSFKRYALDGVPFTVRVFLDHVAIGEVYNFSAFSKARNGTSHCPNCQAQEDVDATVYGQVFMSEELVEAVKNDAKSLKTLTKDEIIAYVKSHLSYKVYGIDGKELHFASVELRPFIGFRKLHKIPRLADLRVEAGNAKTSLRTLVADHALSANALLRRGVTDIDGIDLKDLPDLKAHWDEDTKTIAIMGIKEGAHDPIAFVKPGGWGAYEAF
ncbi:tyrosinase [Coprinopsis sp. MPI-PUGE-AT-0042]|nr:tyrosinase [Coprinopsis sp. MPI-PUGE-AT-0042]